MNNTKKSTSSFWSDRFFGSDSITDSWSVTEKATHDIYKLASAKRAISNFVSIVTNKRIPVKFKSDNHSYTDGKTVTLGSKISDPADFDVAVGLALHEGSHIKLSNFNLLKQIETIIPDKLYDLGNDIGYDRDKIKRIIKDLWNVVEDRRIDDFIYSTAPGYRGYYQAMYNKYFNNDVIDTALKSDKHSEENLNSYMFRIINLHNPNTRVYALKKLPQIYKLVGLGTISRLKTSSDAFEIALKVFEIIMEALSEELENEQEKEAGDGNESSDESESGSESGEGKSTSEKSDSSESESEGGGGKSDTTDGDEEEESEGGGSSESTETESDEETQNTDEYDYEGDMERAEKEKEIIEKFNEALGSALEKAIEEQQSFLDGDIEKEKLDQNDTETMDNIEKSGIEISSVGSDVTKNSGRYPQNGIDCIVVKKLTNELLNSAEFPLTSVRYGVSAHRYYEDEVTAGIRMGTILGKKLQVRAESRTTIFNRQKNGKIDKRMISSLGFGNENVFQYNEVDQYNKANVHISIDASGSMNGTKWEKTLTNVTALCKAVDMIPNLDIQISIRTTTNGGAYLPYIVMAYDSRVDKFSKVKQMFPCLRTSGTTPEGLCFEAIERNFIPGSTSMDSYFINISDGEPYYSDGVYSYQGQSALEHTRDQVKKLRMNGIKVLSYFVSNYRGTKNSDFRTMYGKSSEFIDINSIGEITKTINRMFMTK